MGIASSRQREQNNQELEVNDNQVVNERSAEDDRRQRRHLLSDEDNRGANDDGKYWSFSSKKLSRINIWNSKILWHKKLICGTIAAIIGIDRRNNEGEGSSAIRGNRRGKKRVRRYLRHMEDENDCNTSDDELQDNTNNFVSKIFNWLNFGWVLILQGYLTLILRSFNFLISV